MLVRQLGPEKITLCCATPAPWPVNKRLQCACASPAPVEETPVPVFSDSSWVATTDTRLVVNALPHHYETTPFITLSGGTRDGSCVTFGNAWLL